MPETDTGRAFTPADDEPVPLSEAVRQGFVYFIQVKGFVKIGYATNVYHRLNHIKVASPFPVKLLHAEPCQGRLEHILHDRFRAYHHRGEWFLLSQEIKDHIAMLKSRHA